MGFIVDKVPLGQVFSEYFVFPRQFSFPLVLHTHHHLSSGAGTIGQRMAEMPSVTSAQKTKKKNNKINLCFLVCIFYVRGHAVA
jgi:hypothetical protein